MRTSDTIGKLADAMAKAQAEIGGAKKDGTNPHFRSQYATLASAWAAWQDVGPKNGLSIMQGVSSDDGASVVTTRLAHSSGEWIESEIRLKMQKDDMQGLGSAITYARRYSLMAIAGIAPADDDDGNAAVASGAKPAPKKAAPKKPEKDPKAEASKLFAALEAAPHVTAFNATLKAAHEDGRVELIRGQSDAWAGRFDSRVAELLERFDGAENDTPQNVLAAG